MEEKTKAMLFATIQKQESELKSELEEKHAAHSDPLTTRQWTLYLALNKEIRPISYKSLIELVNSALPESSPLYTLSEYDSAHGNICPCLLKDINDINSNDRVDKIVLINSKDKTIELSSDIQKINEKALSLISKATTLIMQANNLYRKSYGDGQGKTVNNENAELKPNNKQYVERKVFDKVDLLDLSTYK